MTNHTFFPKLIAGIIALPGIAWGQENQPATPSPSKNEPSKKESASKSQANQVIENKTTTISRVHSESQDNRGL